MSSKRKPLNELTRRLPTVPEYEKTFSTLRELPDYATAILGSAILEAFVERRIAGVLKNFDKTIENDLFGIHGPLSSFDSKIIMGVSLGVIPEDSRKSLESIKKIRNTFAHSKVLLSFKSCEIINEINSNITPLAKEIAHKLFGEEIYIENGCEKAIFVFYLKLTLTIIDIEHKKSKGANILISSTSNKT